MARNGLGNDPVIFNVALAGLNGLVAIFIAIGAIKILRGDARGMRWLVGTAIITLGTATLEMLLTAVMGITMRQTSMFQEPITFQLLGSVANGIGQCAFPANVILLGYGYRKSAGHADPREA